MNFKTTLVLLVLLVAVGGYVLFTRSRGEPAAPTVPVVHTVLDVKSADVTALTVTGPDSKPVLAMEKAGDAWRLTRPIRAAVDPFKASTLVDDLTTNLRSTNVVATGGPDAPKTGVDHPQYSVELTAAGRPVRLALGDRLAVGDGVYAQVAGRDAVDVVPTTILDTLARPASDLRKTQLFDGVASADVKQLTVTHKDGSKVTLAKVNGSWTITAPSPMPADSSAVSDLLATVLNLTPVSFVDDPADAVGLTRPTAVVSFTTAAPTTAPTTAPATGPAPTVVTIGGYDDVEKKNVFAALSDGTIVKVAASVVDSLSKSPLDLRDKTVVDVDPARVTRVEIATEATAASRPATTGSVVLTRTPPKPAIMGPTPGTTRPTTAPTTAWLVDGTPADDAKVTALLGQFHPLKADKFLPTSGVVQPARRFTLMLTAGGPPTVIHLDDLGHDLSLVGTADGLTFNLPASLATDLTGDFRKGTAAAAAPAGVPAMPGTPAVP